MEIEVLRNNQPKSKKMNKIHLTIVALLINNYIYSQTPKIDCNCIYPNADPQEIKYEKVDSLLKQKNYWEAIQLCESFLAKDSSDQYSMQYLSELLFYMAEINSGNMDPSVRTRFLIIEEEIKLDNEQSEYVKIRRRIGPNSWTSEVMDKYLAKQNCINSCLRYNYPRNPNYLTRQMAIYISTNRYELLIKTMIENGKEQVDIEESVGEFYARFTERFVGVGNYGQGVDYLLEVIRVYGISLETKEYWKEVYSAIISEEFIDLQLKESLIDKLNQI